MKLAILTGAVALLGLAPGLASPAQAQVAQPAMAAPATFEDAAYITCREAQGMIRHGGCDGHGWGCRIPL